MFTIMNNLNVIWVGGTLNDWLGDSFLYNQVVGGFIISHSKYYSAFHKEVKSKKIIWEWHCISALVQVTYYIQGIRSKYRLMFHHQTTSNSSKLPAKEITILSATNA